MNETGHDRRRGPSKASVENGVRGGDARRRWMTLIGHDQRQDAERFRREHTSGSLKVCDYPGTSARVAGNPFSERPVGASEGLFDLVRRHRYYVGHLISSAPSRRDSIMEEHVASWGSRRGFSNAVLESQ